MRRIAITITTVGVALAAAGCDGVIFKELDINDGSGVSLDARQRAILVNEKGGPNGNRRVVCAEPSPDALAAKAASIAASIGAASGNKSAQGALAAASSETAASIGLRTQTIQILRDQLFRACEGYMNGVVTKFQYNAIVLNMDRVIVNALATDALAGTPTAPAVAIGTSANSNGQSTTSGDSEKKVTDAEADANTNSLEGAFHNAVINNQTFDRHRSEALTRIAIGMQRQPRTHILCLSLLSEPTENGGKPHVDKDVREYCRHVFRHATHALYPLK